MMGMCVKAYQKVFGGAEVDAFQFQCPLPGLGAFAASDKSADPAYCCHAYRSLGWPFQFRECETLTPCVSCSRHTPAVELHRHPVADLAGVAWASSLAVYSEAKPVESLGATLARFGGGLLGPKMGDRALDGRRITATIDGSGTGGKRVDLCPAITDWHELMLNDDKDNIHARVFKSAAKKLAVVVFRGTQMTSMKNWQVDANLARRKLELGGGFPPTEVHEGFLKSLDRILPRVKTWLNGYMLGLVDSIPEDWTVLFTGHSLGGALATLAATLAELQGWGRVPDAVVTFGGPRVADGVLSRWWKARGLCKKLLRVVTFNDVIHYMPLKTAFNWWEVASDIMKCAASISVCAKRGPEALMSGSGNGPELSSSDRWEHICGEESEFVVESRVRGINQELEEVSPLGGAMAHFIDNCHYGYSYGVLKSAVPGADRYCNISRAGACQP